MHCFTQKGSNFFITFSTVINQPFKLRFFLLIADKSRFCEFYIPIIIKKYQTFNGLNFFLMKLMKE